MASSSPVLVTGGTGFIGRHLVRQLQQERTPVRLLVRSARKAEALFGPSVELVEGDLTRAADVTAACRGISRVFHLGGYYQFGLRHRTELWQTNVVGTTHVLEACRRLGVERLIHCSTAGVLKSNHAARTHRDFPAHPPAGCYYKISKWHAEQATLTAARQGLPVVIASPTAPLGPGDERPTPTGRMLLDLVKGRFPVCTRTGLNVVAVEDVVAGLLAISAQGQAGERYILGHTNLWLVELLQQAARHAQVRPPRAVVPWPLVAVGGVLADAWGWLGGSGGDRLCWETAFFARQRQFFDCSHSHEALGWRPKKSLDETLAAAIAWFTTR